MKKFLSSCAAAAIALSCISNVSVSAESQYRSGEFVTTGRDYELNKENIEYAVSANWSDIYIEKLNAVRDSADNINKKRILFRT